MINKFKYQDPLENGFKKVKISRQEHNKLFEKRKLKIFHSYEYYISDKKFIMHRYVNVLGIFISILLFPFYLLMAGLSNFKELMTEYDDLFHQRKRGKFVSDECWCTSDTYKIVKRYIEDV